MFSRNLTFDKFDVYTFSSYQNKNNHFYEKNNKIFFII